MKLNTLIASAALIFGITQTATAGVIIEDFEDGSLSEYSVSTGSGITSAGIAASGAHDGALGLNTVSSSQWIYRDDITVSEGDTLAWWVLLGNSGRAYMGFGADDEGTQSFVLASNTRDIRFQNNFDYRYQELDTSSQGFDFNKWYLAEVVWGLGGLVTGNLYDSDGTTLLNSVSSTVGYSTSGGLAFRGFSNVSFDTVTLTRGANVPTPGVGLLMGLGLFALFAQRRRAASK